MIDFDMDCSLTDNGWFEFKGWLANGGDSTGWESDIYQGTCSGSAGLAVPFDSKDHMARCGFINVFEWNENGCVMEPFNDHTTVDSYTTIQSTASEAPIPTTVAPSLKTIILFHKKVYDDQYVFIRGGLDEEKNPSKLEIRK